MAAGLDKYADLHEEDDLAFAELVEQYQLQLQNNLNHLERNDDATQYYLEYMRKVLAAASALNVDAFENWRMPNRSTAFDDYEVFEFDVQKYVMTAEIRKSRAVKVYSVELSSTAKTQIHFFIERIRDVVETADLEAGKKNSLFKKLNAFSADVDKTRTSFGNAMLMGIDIAHLAKEFGDAIKPATEFVRSINELLGGEKAKEPEQAQLPPPAKKLEPPRKRIEGPGEQRKDPEFGRDMDDDIPF